MLMSKVVQPATCCKLRGKAHMRLSRLSLDLLATCKGLPHELRAASPPCSHLAAPERSQVFTTRPLKN